MGTGYAKRTLDVQIRGWVRKERRAQAVQVDALLAEQRLQLARPRLSVQPLEQLARARRVVLVPPDRLRRLEVDLVLPPLVHVRHNKQHAVLGRLVGTAAVTDAHVEERGAALIEGKRHLG